MMRTLFLALSFCCVAPAFAEDAKQIILALPDEAAECRYIESLRTTARASWESITRLYDEAEQDAARGQTATAAGKMVVANKSFQQYVAPHWGNIFSAVEAIKIKRGELPPCAATLDADTRGEFQRTAAEALARTERSRELIQRLR